MVKIAIIGAGSTVFMKNIVTDIVLEPGLETAHIALHDIDEARLATSEKVAQRIAKTTKTKPTVSVTLNRRAALQDADFVITMIKSAAMNRRRLLISIFRRNMGCAKPLATRWVWAALCEAYALFRCSSKLLMMADCCPDALLLQYVNPMAINCFTCRNSRRN